jgi:hypothetical protein
VSEGFAPEAVQPPAVLPSEMSLAEALAWPPRVAGSQAGAAVVLIDIDAKGLDS